MKKTIRRLVQYGSLCFVILLTQAEVSDRPDTYYVSPAGSDSNDGTTLKSPLATLTMAAGLAKPGDKILVRGGTYKNQKGIIIGCKGTKDHPIVFMPYRKEKPVLDFSENTAKGSSSTAVSFTDGTCNVIFEGFEIANGHSTGVRMTHCNNITVRDCIIHDFDNVGLSVASDDCLIENNELYRICMAFENCNNLTGGWPQVMNTSAKPPVPPAIVRSHAINNTFRGNYIHDCWGEGIDPMFSDGVIIEDNVIHDVFSIGIYMDGTRNAIIRNNYIYTTDNKRIRNDIKQLMAGVQMGSEYFGGWSDYPAISHVENIYIYNNVLSRVGSGIEHWKDRNNTDRKNIYENVKIFNNTVDTYEGRGDGIRFSTSLDFPTRGNECKNNIFRSSQNCRAEKGFVFENNHWVNGIPKDGNHINSLTGDPGWVNPVPGGDINGYRLKDNSICIGKGQPVKGLTTDKFGKKRNSMMTPGAIEAGRKLNGNPGEAVSTIEDLKKQPLPGFRIGVNIALNPDFDVIKNNYPSDWNLKGDSVAFSFFSPGHITRIKAGSAIADKPATERCVKLGGKENVQVYLFQNLTNIPDGRYGFHARVKRFGEGGEMYSEIAGYGGEVLRCTIPLAKTLNEWSDYSKSFFQLNISDIEVINGKCTIGFFVKGGAEDYALIDDIVFYRY